MKPLIIAAVFYAVFLYAVDAYPQTSVGVGITIVTTSTDDETVICPMNEEGIYEC